MIANIDTLVISFDVLDYDKSIGYYSKSLEESKEKSRNYMYNNESKRETVQFGNVKFEVMANGARMYAYLIHNDLIEIRLAKIRSNNKDTLPIVVSFKSTLLWSKGLNAYFYAERIINNVFGSIKTTKISRVDMALHMDKYTHDQLHLDEFIGQFKKDSIHRFDRKIETLYFGSRKTQKVLCRIYNKTREVIETKSKLWFFDIWEKENLDIMNVWNVEFELHRDFLREINIDTFTDLIDNLKGIWYYLTHEWIRHIDMSTATRRERCHVRPIWHDIQDGYNKFDMDGYIDRDLQRLRDLNKYVPGAVGYLTSLSAMSGIDDVDDAMAFLRYEMDRYFTIKKETTFEEVVHTKMNTYSTANSIATVMK